MRALAFLSLTVVACSGGNFEVGSAGADTAPTEDTATAGDTTTATEAAAEDTSRPVTESGVPDGNVSEAGVSEVGVFETGGPIDTGTTTVDAGCVAVGHSATDVYVNASAAPGGTGAIACPLQTVGAAAAIPLGPGVTRVVHVAAGTYNQPGFLRIRTLETYRGEGGIAKLVSAGASLCAPSGQSCAVLIDSGGTCDGFLVEGSSTYGIVTNGTGGTPPRIVRTTAKGALRDGIVIYGDAATLGPDARAINNGWAGLVMRGSGKLSIAGPGSQFDNNKGGYYSGATYIPGGGINMMSGQLFIDGGTTSNDNSVGIAFDAGYVSTAEQVISQHTANNNRGSGIFIPKQWSKVTLRRTTTLKNAQFGLFISYGGDGTLLDLGTITAPGNNTFGTVGIKNQRGGIMLCNSGPTGSQLAESDNWSTCAPTQISVPNCDTTPTAYVDVAYAPRPGATPSSNPLALPINCTSPP